MQSLAGSPQAHQRVNMTPNLWMHRYDNVWRDWEGNLVTGLAPFPPPTPVDVPRQQQAAAGNCVLLTGAPRHQQHLTVRLQPRCG